MFKQVLRITAVGGGSGIQVALLAVLSLLLAKYLSVNDFGITRTITAYMVVLTMFGHFCLHDAVTAYVAGAEDRKAKKSYAMTGTYLVLGISVGVCLVTEAIILYGGIWSGQLQRVFAGIVLFLPFVSLTIVYSSLLQAIGSYRLLSLFLVLGGVFPLLCVAPLAAHWHLPGWLAGRSLAYVVLLAVATLFIRNLWSFERYDAVSGRKLVSFARLQFMSGILSMIVQSADIIALERLKGDMMQVAIYGLASLFSKSVLFLPGAVGRVYFKEIAEGVGTAQGPWRGITHLLVITSVLCAALSIVMFLVVPCMIRALYGLKYMESIPVFRTLALGVVFWGIWGALSVVNIAMKKPEYAIIISATGVVTCIVLLYVLVPSFGATGAAWGMNGASFAGSAVGVYMLFRIRKKVDGLNVNPA